MYQHSELALQVEAPPLSENLSDNGGDCDVPSSSQDMSSQKPVKKQTRQWEAWTRQEEENFFNALRQVGKNFEKITCRVQSKNKDQVRYYYYRLVRRINKLLGPGFYLDAKNSRDTNAAMLRWWSLLEKYSCPASKLRLKPRRFKIFIEALEHQLLKDRNKSQKKRSTPADNCSSAASASMPLLSKGQSSDARSVKLLVVDGQGSQKNGSGKATSMRRNATASNACKKVDSANMKASRQRQKTGVLSAVAFRRWEKAAIAGVSLVADAAEQLERTALATKGGPDELNSNQVPHEACHTDSQKGASQSMFSHLIPDTGIQPSVKLKLQLFPIDETTRRALEMDEHNPHLELTLSARKKISSVLGHLNRKWGSSSGASGEIMLFPYYIQVGNLAGCKSWTLKDTVASAADVYADVGSPAVFRLRYGWSSNAEPSSCSVQLPHVSPCTIGDSPRLENTQEVGSISTSFPDGAAIDMAVALKCASIGHVPKEVVVPKNLLGSTMMDETALRSHSILSDHRDLPVSPEPATSTPWLQEDSRDGIGNLRTSSGTVLSAGEWADSLTNISMGDLFAEASRAADGNCIGRPDMESVPCAQQIPFSSDSFDAAIAAHFSGSRNIQSLTTHVPHESSIWDAEDTCDAFAFQTIAPAVPSLLQGSSGACKEDKCADSLGFHSLVKDFLPTEDPVSNEDPMIDAPCDIDNHTDYLKDVALSNIYWPDSLGPLDLDVPSRYRGQELILGDSISLGAGLNRLIASSLDAFQNCSFFASDKKEQVRSETQEAAQFSGFNVGEV